MSYQLLLCLLFIVALCQGVVNPGMYKGVDKITSILYEFDCTETTVTGFTKTLTPEKSKIIDTPFRTGVGYCADALSPGVLDLGAFKSIPVAPKDRGTPNWKHLRNLGCCKFNSCPGCYDLLTGSTCVLKLYAVKESGAQELLPTLLCGYCRQMNCFTGDCTNGQYASQMNELDPVTYLSIVKVGCRNCEPGTWNTCVLKDTCSWSVPELGFTNISTDVHVIGIGPVFSCYACQDAESNTNHYMNSKTKKSQIQPLNQWKCPGGSAPPTMCPANNFVHSKNYATCVCKPGYYSLDEINCIPCEPGYYCMEGVKTQCPAHYFQSNSAGTQCLPCVDTANETGKFILCGDGQQLQWCLPDNIQTQNKPLSQNCIPCHQCARTFITPTNGERRCYRS